MRRCWTARTPPFDIYEVVLRIAVELELADLDERIVLVRPHLGQVERVEVIGPASTSGMICTHSGTPRHGVNKSAVAYRGLPARSCLVGSIPWGRW